MCRCSTVVDASTGGCHIDHPDGWTIQVDVQCCLRWLNKRMYASSRVKVKFWGLLAGCLKAGRN
jgi:hypothetical protein